MEGKNERGKARVEIVSNMNTLRTNQIVDIISRADKVTHTQILHPAKKIIIAERNPAYLQEIVNKILLELMPENEHSWEHHNMPHYVVCDGKVNFYENTSSDGLLVGVRARVKHPCSLGGEKIGRQIAEFGRDCELYDSHKLLIRDVYGMQLIAKTPEDVPSVEEKLRELPYFQILYHKHHHKSNGYHARHFNMVYENGNPIMRGLTLELQVTDAKTHEKNMNGKRCGHDSAYGAEKLNAKRDIGDRQIVVVGNSVQIPKGLCKVHEFEDCKIAHVPNPINPYLLVVPKYN
ncbi:hypothetical protein HOK51_01365 [Candidatus Woesearchaeota archaeon]|jgi:hypothetical protein|nr:hypothetical protein [Candidatus Woesearchaeota archaeon]MBT6518462.1 hypothetical protein [Candidatus Woesearchaeota archaeon]MBT7367050.1 hypothetical protein [Candidatus Woesearchaeota archaeon]